MKIVLHGYGQMGQRLASIISQTENVVVGIVDFKGVDGCYQSINDVDCDVDVVIDFSNNQIVDELINYVEVNDVMCVFATTNLSDEQLNRINELGAIRRVFQSYNTSYGVYAMTKLLNECDRLFDDEFDVSLLDVHHNKKVDAPSGTAKLLDGCLPSHEVDIKDFRVGGVYGTHTVSFTSSSEMIKVEHMALNRDVFAYGALKACVRLCGLENGCYNLSSLYEGEE
jgi:4-hydroxy-tetrahydrodipicolinate reductase